MEKYSMLDMNNSNIVNYDSSKAAYVRHLALDYEIMDAFNNRIVTSSDKEHPMVFGNLFLIKNALSISKEYYLNNKKEIDEMVIDICNRTTNEDFFIHNGSFINSEVINAIAKNPHIKNVRLGTGDDPYTLSYEDYLLFKSNNKEGIFTNNVSSELENNFDKMIKYNTSKKLLSNYVYSDLKNNKNLYLDKIIPENLPNLKLIGDNVECISFNADTMNLNLMFDAIKEIDNNKKDKVEIKVKDKKIINNYLFNNLDILSDLKGVKINLSSQFENIDILDYIKYENMLNDMIKDAQDLSPFEKYLYAYNKVKSFKEYKENDEDRDSARNLYKILDNNYIVCVGFSHLLIDLLDKLGIEAAEEVLSVEVGLDKVKNELEPLDDSIVSEKVGHQRTRVHLVDPKYDIDGYYVSDATWDNDLKYDLYNHSLMTSQEEISLKRYNYMGYTVFNDLLYCNSEEEFYKKVNMFLDNPKTFLKKDPYEAFFNNFYDLFSKFDKEFIEEVNSKFGKLNEYGRKFNDKEEISDIITFIAEKILAKTNNIISGEKYKEAITKLYRDVYKYDDYENLVEEVMEYNKIIQEYRFPVRYIEHKDGTKEPLFDMENKFDIAKPKTK